MKLFDLHCDTSSRLLDEKQGLLENDFHISLNKASYLENYAQVMAIWSNYKLSDGDAYIKFFKVLENLKNEIRLNADRVELNTDSSRIDGLWNTKKIPLILAVEDARILENDLSRLDTLYENGVRLLTLNWYGETCIGGAHDTSASLSAFGIEVVKRSFEIGIIPDISHSSFAGASKCLEIAMEYKKPIVASHSDSYTVNPHTRNLRDEDFIAISKLRGLVGINLCPSHLSSEDANIKDIISHIEHYLSLGGENTIAMGGDLDGTNLPCGFSGVNDIYKIADEMLALNYSTELIEKIMYKNAYEFFKRNL